MDDGRYMTLAIVFDEAKENVLMCWHVKQGRYNFIGGKSKVGEDLEDTTYRELYEESGITRDDVDLQFLWQERVACAVPGFSPCWTLHVMTGILKKPVELREENNPLQWIPLSKHDVFQYFSFGNGNCWTYLLGALAKLGIECPEPT